MSEQGRPAPLKPWERAGAASSSMSSGGPSPFAPPSATNSTAEAVAVAGTVGMGNSEQEKHLASVSGRNTVGRPVPSRPWSQSQAGYQSGYGMNGGLGVNSGSAYGGFGGMNSRCGSIGTSGYGMGSYGSSYGSSAYGGYGSGGYGSSMYGGGGMYGNRCGMGGGMGGMGGYGSYGGMGGMSGYGQQGYGMVMDPNNPNGPPRGPPSFWQNMLQGLHHFLSFFGRLSILVDENTQAVHFFMTALLQLCDRAGVLYGELARFVLRLLGVKARRRLKGQDKPGLLEGPRNDKEVPRKSLTGGEPGWDNLWGGEGSGPN